MKKIRLLALMLIACALALCIGLSACDALPPDSEKPDGPDSQITDPDGQISDGNEIEILDPDDTEHDFVLKSEADGTYTYKCSDCDKEITVYISCESGTEHAYTIENNTITFSNITENSVYDISGNFHGNIVINVADSYKFELQMGGFELYSFKECPVTVLGGDKVTLSAKKSTENYIYDMREAVDSDDENAVSSSVYAKCDLDIQGKGSLSIKSINNNGIHTKDDLNVKNLNLQVDCLDNALKGNDSVTVESGTVVLIARQGDGIKTTNSDVSSKGNQRGTVAITGGDILIYAACDGIDAAYNATIEETASTTVQIFTDKYSKYSEKVTAVSNSISYSRTNAIAQGPGGGMGGPGGMGGMDDGNTDKGDYSTKGIKADNEIVISAGNITISAYDDAIHANSDTALENSQSPLGNVTVKGGSLTLRSNDDAIHADNGVAISGGSINILGSYEGIEGTTVEISGGEVSVISSDDGINGTATSGTAITISGGTLYVYAGGDGVDSNSQTRYGGIIFSGGKSVIISTGNSDSSIDTEQGYTYTGGYVVGICRSGGMSSESTNCSNFNSIGTKSTISLQKDAYLVVKDVVTVKMPVSVNALVVYLNSSGASISSSASTSYDLDSNGVYWN